MFGNFDVVLSLINVVGLATQCGAVMVLVTVFAGGKCCDISEDKASGTYRYGTVRYGTGTLISTVTVPYVQYAQHARASS